VELSSLLIVGNRREYSLPITDSVFVSNYYYIAPASHSCTMDALKAEIASKRKALQDDPVVSSRPTKYMRRGDIERLKQEQEREEREESEWKEREEREKMDEVAAIKKAARMKVCT
jgi:hypothetical protein